MFKTLPYDILLCHDVELKLKETIIWFFRYNPIYQPKNPISDQGLALGPIMGSWADRLGDKENPML